VQRVFLLIKVLIISR